MEIAYYRHVRPPLGPKPDFDKEKRKKAEVMAAVPHRTIEDFPALVTTFTIATEWLNRFRESLGLEPAHFRQSDIHLIAPAIYADPLFKVKKRKTSGFFDRFQGVCYLEFDPDEYAASEREQVFAAYLLAHELGHKSTGQGGAGNFHLNEGINEDATKQVMDEVLTELFPNRKMDKDGYIKNRRPEFRGIQIQVGELLFVSTEGALGYYYAPEMRLVAFLRGKSPAAYEGLVKLIFQSDYYGVYSYLYEHYGAKIAKLLSSESQAGFPRIAKALALDLN